MQGGGAGAWPLRPSDLVKTISGHMSSWLARRTNVHRCWLPVGGAPQRVVCAATNLQSCCTALVAPPAAHPSAPPPRLRRPPPGRPALVHR